MNFADQYPIADEKVRAEYEGYAQAGIDPNARCSPHVLEAMLNGICQVCGDGFTKGNWLQEAKYCSKECRKARTDKKRGNKKFNKMCPMDTTEEEKNFTPLKIRGFHKIMDLMIDVTAIDWPANKVYGSIPSKGNYPMNFPLSECTMMTNFGGFVDQNGKEIFEGDVASTVVPETKEVVIGVIGLDRQAGGLMLIERTEKEDKRRFLLTAESVKTMAVVGEMFHYEGLVTAISPVDKTVPAVEPTPEPTANQGE